MRSSSWGSRRRAGRQGIGILVGAAVATGLIQSLALGLAWVLPLLPLIKWMERRDEA